MYVWPFRQAEWNELLNADNIAGGTSSRLFYRLRKFVMKMPSPSVLAEFGEHAYGQGQLMAENVKPPKNIFAHIMKESGGRSLPTMIGRWLQNERAEINNRHGCVTDDNTIAKIRIWLIQWAERQANKLVFQRYATIRKGKPPVNWQTINDTAEMLKNELYTIGVERTEDFKTPKYTKLQPQECLGTTSDLEVSDGNVLGHYNEQFEAGAFDGESDEDVGNIARNAADEDMDTGETRVSQVRFPTSARVGILRPSYQGQGLPVEYHTVSPSREQESL